MLLKVVFSWGTGIHMKARERAHLWNESIKLVIKFPFCQKVSLLGSAIANQSITVTVCKMGQEIKIQI